MGNSLVTLRGYGRNLEPGCIRTPGSFQNLLLSRGLTRTSYIRICAGGACPQDFMTAPGISKSHRVG